MALFTCDVLMLASLHHHIVAIVACCGVLLVAVLLFNYVSRGRSRARSAGASHDDSQARRIEERLATGRFSRAPSSFRRKVAVVSEPPKPKEDKETP